jgi:hypothetical protein
MTKHTTPPHTQQSQATEPIVDQYATLYEQYQWQLGL